MLIIGLSGKKQAGKSTAAAHIKKCLEERFQVSVEIVGFADKLKEIVLDCFVPPEWNWGLAELELDENKNRKTPCGKTVRQLLQTVGTDWFREVFSDCWVNAYANTVTQLNVDVVLTPDVRFRNEMKYIQINGGIVMRFTRAPFGETDKHISETALDGVHEYTEKVIHREELCFDVERKQAKLFDVWVDNEDMSFEEKNNWLEKMIKKSFGISSELKLQYFPILPKEK